MDLDEIRALLAVADYGSFTAAARETTLTRTTLRRRIDAFELRLGTPLLDRDVRGATLTPAGQVAVREGRAVLERARSLASAARNVAEVASRPLQIVLACGLPPELTALTLDGVLARFPNTRCSVMFSENPRAALWDEADLAVVLDGLEPGPSWERVTLRPVREWLVATPDYLARHGRPSTLAELADHRLITWRAPLARDARLPLRSGGHIDVEPKLSTSDVHLLRLIAGHGGCLAYLPDARLGAFTPAQPALVPVLTEVVGRDTTLDLLAPRAASEVPAIRAILEVARQLMPALP
ncbi:MAG TPA: LysR family transcriptional regulator [Myxococcota bacterium]|nr:LysR family transcriptional regulator [Myxococcota bacterium]